jgi:hypothetical protein
MSVSFNYTKVVPRVHTSSDMDERAAVAAVVR